MSAAVAPDDIVERHADVAPSARPPLLVLEPLRAFLDEHDLGSGEIKAQPIGDGHSNVTYLIERDSGPELVLRRPPRPPLPPSA
ncbi:MAG: phosphotransferase family protein, partial [Solirubrobacteraceae bacterium]